MPKSTQHTKLEDLIVSYIHGRAGPDEEVDIEIDDRKGYDSPAPINGLIPDVHATVRNQGDVSEIWGEADTTIDDDEIEQFLVFANHVSEDRSRYLIVATPKEFKNKVVEALRYQPDLYGSIDCDTLQLDGQDIAVVVLQGGLGDTTIEFAWQ